MLALSPSELILSKGRVYHLNLQPDEISDTIITVGDPKRVEMISQHFDQIEIKIENREFVTHTGNLGHKRITVLSTGIGTDNIDIVLNELDALANIDLDQRIQKKEKKKLKIIRIGTSGSIHPSIQVDDFVISSYALGLDGLLHFYKYNPSSKEQSIKSKFDDFLKLSSILLPVAPYIVEAAPALLNKYMCVEMKKGLVLTAPGFYAPQGRDLLGQTKFTKATIKKLNEFDFDGLNLTNMEMETAGIYGLCNHLGHEAISFNAILANRWEGTFSKNPVQTIATLINKVLDLLLKN